MNPTGHGLKLPNYKPKLIFSSHKLIISGVCYSTRKLTNKSLVPEKWVLCGWYLFTWQCEEAFEIGLRIWKKYWEADQKTSRMLSVEDTCDSGPNKTRMLTGMEILKSSHCCFIRKGEGFQDSHWISYLLLHVEVCMEFCSHSEMLWEAELT